MSGGGDHVFAIGDGDIQPAEAFAAAVAVLDEAQGGVVQIDRRAAVGVCRDRPLHHLRPASGHRRRIAALQLGGGHGADELLAPRLLRVLARAGGVPGAVGRVAVAVPAQLGDRAGHILGMQLDAVGLVVGRVQHQSDAERGDVLAASGDVVALHDHHVAAVAAASLDVASTGCAWLEGRDDLQESVADGHQEVVQPKPREAGIAVADFESEYAAQMRLNVVEVLRDEADLTHTQHVGLLRCQARAASGP